MESLFTPGVDYSWEQIRGMMADLVLSHADLVQSHKETERKSQETERKFQETDKKFQETDKKFQETREEMRLSALSTEKTIKETQAEIKSLNNLFKTQWGKLIEALIAPSGVRLFRERGIDVEQTSTNIEVYRENLQVEYDIILVNRTELVVVEVKTTFKPEYVDEFLESLQQFKFFLPQYANYTVYGATAALKYEGKSDKYAYRKGLFVIRSSGEGLMKIANDTKFTPNKF